jgi:hypothetical protein
MNYKPLSRRAIQQIKAWDKKYHHGINQTRFYTWLVHVGSDVQIRHVAVKTARVKLSGGRTIEQPVVKEVARFSVDDDECHIKDLVFYHAGGGYSVDWRPEGLDNYDRPYDYGGEWESEPYKPSGLWHINAVVINPKVLKRTKRFRYCNWWSNCGDIVQYLKTYEQYPGIELLSKLGLAFWSQKPAIYKKCHRDKQFAKFLVRNVAEIRECHYTIPQVLKAYRDGLSIRDVVDEQTRKELEAKRVDEDKLAEVAEAWSWLEKQGRKYCIVLPRTHADFVAEGKALEHCVLEEHYAQKVTKGKSIIAFVRMRDSKDAPLVTVEYDLKQAKVTQCYGKRNSTPDKGVKTFVDRVFDRVKQVEIKEVAA